MVGCYSLSTVRSLRRFLFLVAYHVSRSAAFSVKPKIERRLPKQLDWQIPLLSIVTTIVVASSPALALEASVYTNDYSDPFYPLCKRHVQVAPDGKTFHYSGTVVGPKDDPVRRGCSPPEIREFGLRNGAFDGEILPDGRISAGDGIHEGVWEAAGSATGTNLGNENVDGIRWNDGNKWVVKPKSLATEAFKWFFLTYIGVSTLAGMNEMVKRAKNLVDRKKEEVRN
jgi:hypothetical protein